MVIRDAMKNKDRVALSRIVMVHREHIMTLKPLGNGILGTTLRGSFGAITRSANYRHLGKLAPVMWKTLAAYIEG